MGNKPTKGIKPTINEEDFNEYLELLKSTGTTVDVEKLSPEALRKYQNDAWLWVQDGKKKAIMPSVESKLEIVLKVYREKKLGKQYLYWRTQDGVVGKEFENKYEQIEVLDDKNQPTGQFTNGEKILSTETIFTQEYKKPLAEELVEKCLNTSPEPRFYIVKGQRKIAVEPEDFTGDVDQIVKSTLQAITLSKR